MLVSDGVMDGEPSEIISLLESFGILTAQSKNNGCMGSFQTGDVQRIAAVGGLGYTDSTRESHKKRLDDFDRSEETDCQMKRIGLGLLVFIGQDGTTTNLADFGGMGRDALDGTIPLVVFEIAVESIRCKQHDGRKRKTNQWENCESGLQNESNSRLSGKSCLPKDANGNEFFVLHSILRSTETVASNNRFAFRGAFDTKLRCDRLLQC